MFPNNFFNPFGFLSFMPFLLGFVILDLILKALALWKAARNTQKIWFIAILLINSFGILPAIYLLLFSKKKKS